MEVTMAVQAYHSDVGSLDEFFKSIINLDNKVPCLKFNKNIFRFASFFIQGTWCW
jgi:uncharacterized protein YerC